MRRVRAVAVALGVASCLLPAQALGEAPPATGVGTKASPLTSPGGFQVDASNGYTLTVIPQPAVRRRPPSVLAALARPGASVIYTAKGEVRDEGFAVDFGPVGRIDVHYVPDGIVRHQRYHCDEIRGKQPNVFFLGGSYAGTVEIRGEERFGEFVAGEVPGDMRWVLGCGGEIREGLPAPGVVLDSGLDRRALPKPAFSAIQNKPGGSVVFDATLAEQAGQVFVFREVLIRAEAASLSFDRRLDSASASPPAPFAGGAEFERRSRRLGSWRGDLSVDFPGKSGVALAGPDFVAILRHGFREFSRAAAW